jgi:hypothetical protein
MTPCTLVNSYQVSEYPVANIFRIHGVQEPLLTFPDTEERGKNLLRNLKLIPIDRASYPRTLKSADFYLLM